MNFEHGEKINNLLENQSVKKVSGKGKEFDPERRKFIKAGIGGALGLAGLGTIKKSIDFFTGGDKDDSFYENQNECDSSKIINEEENNEPKEILEKTEPLNAHKERIEISETKNIADDFLDAYHELRKTEFWNSKILTDNLFMAQQLQESKYKKDSESGAGAVGVMQTRGTSIRDIPMFLAKLKRNVNFKYNGPDNLDDKQVEEIKSLIKKHADYGRAFGKIYMAMLCDNKYGYGVGEDSCKRGDIKTAQKEILAVFNGGLGNITYRLKGCSRQTKSEREWPKETREYYKKVFNYEQRIKNIKQAFLENNINLNNREVVALAIEMDKYDSKKRYVMLNKYIKSKINI